MPTGSWKNHEKAVAAYFNGTRMSRSNYGIDAPDVLVPASVSINTVGYKGDTIIECKYSIDMVWHKLCFNILTENDNIIRCKNLRIFDITNTKKLIPAILSNKIDVYLELEKTIPKYLKDWIQQSESYGSYAKNGIYLPILCLGQKSSRKKLGIINQDYIKKTIVCSNTIQTLKQMLEKL